MANEPQSCGGSSPHQFEPRYDEIGQKLDFPETFGMFSTAKVEGPAYQRIYRGDVCVKCGKIVQMTKAATPHSTDQPEQP